MSHRRFKHTQNRDKKHDFQHGVKAGHSLDIGCNYSLLLQIPRNRHPQDWSGSSSMEVPQHCLSSRWGPVQQYKVFPKSVTAELNTTRDTAAEKMPCPQKSLRYLVDFTLHMCRSKATPMSTSVQTHVCNWSSALLPQQSSSMGIAVALPWCVSEWDRRCRWHWNITFNATNLCGTLLVITPERLLTPQCTELNKDGFFHLQGDQVNLAVYNMTLSPNDTEKDFKWVNG